MANRNGISEKFIEKVINLLEVNDFTNAVKTFSADDHQIYLKSSCWDLVPILCEHIAKGSKHNNQDLIRCSKELLHKLAIEGDPEEGVLEFLDQFDEINAEKFQIILDCLKILISRNNMTKSRALEWTFNSVRFCMEQLAKENELEELDLPGNKNEVSLTSNELDNVMKFMNSFILFCKYFIDELEQNPSNNDKEIEILISSRLLQIFDLFFPYINLQNYPELKVIEDRLQTLVLKLIPNPMSLLKYVFCRALNNMKPILKQKATQKTLEELIEDDASLTTNNKIFIHPYEDVIVVSDLAFGMFFFTILGNENIEIPMVYNPKYIMMSLIHVIIPFFEKKTDIAIHNGLKFLNLLIDQLNDLLERSDLYFSSHKSILINLNNIMIFSPKEENRKLALICFKKYINCFNWEAKYYLLLKLRAHVTHSGTLGYLVILLKDFLSEFLKLPKNSEVYQRFSKYYRGKLLFDMIKEYCFLINGGKTDLIENADHIISSLNVLLYLILRDKLNVMDLKRFIQKIKINFLNPLEENVKSSRSYYETKLKDIENDENKTGNGKEKFPFVKSDVKIELSLQNEILPKLTFEQQKIAYQSCINAVDLIDLLRKRLIEYI